MQTMPENKYCKTHHQRQIKHHEKKGTENCKKREVIYAAQCSKHKGLHIGQTGEQLPERSSTHPYDIKNSKLAKHFRKSHNINGNLNITILQNDNQNCSRTKVS